MAFVLCWNSWLRDRRLSELLWSSGSAGGHTSRHVQRRPTNCKRFPHPSSPLPLSEWPWWNWRGTDFKQTSFRDLILSATRHSGFTCCWSFQNKGLINKAALHIECQSKHEKHLSYHNPSFPFTEHCCVQQRRERKLRIPEWPQLTCGQVTFCSFF